MLNVSLYVKIRYNNEKRPVLIIGQVMTKKEAYISMKTLLILGVSIVFLACIFTAGFEDKPGDYR